jgi:hypothetical protein
LFEVAFEAGEGGGGDEEFRTALAAAHEDNLPAMALFIDLVNGLMDLRTWVTINSFMFITYQLAMIVCFSLGIAGAISYNNRLIFVAVAVYCQDLLFSFCGNDINNMEWNALCIYSHASLIMEIRSGIMSPLGDGTSTTSSTNKQGYSFCGVCCNMVSNKIPIVPLICY